MPAIRSVVAATYSVKILIGSFDNESGCRAVIDGTTYGNNASAYLTAGDHTLVASTPLGWGFLTWSGFGGVAVGSGTSPSTTLTVSGNGFITGDWGPQVTFNTSPSGSGTIIVYYYGAPIPFGETYSNGQSAVIKAFSSELRANPSLGYQFTSWQTTGSVSVNSPSSTPTFWSPNGPGTVTANFATVNTVTFYVRSGSTAVAGTITLGASTFSDSQSGSFSSQAYSLSATPPSPVDQWKFYSWIWTGSVQVQDSSSQSTTATISGSGTIKAVFEAAVTLYCDPTSAGHIAVSGSWYSNGNKHWCFLGDSFSIEAEAYSGYAFSSWSCSGGCSVGSSSGYSTTGNIGSSPGSITANFIASGSTTYTVNFYTSPPGGTITFNGNIYSNGGSGSYQSGAYNITANAPFGYSFSSWGSSGGVSVTNPSSQSTTATVSGTGSLTATFAVTLPTSYKVTFYTNPSSVGSITFSGTTYTNGQFAQYQANTYTVIANVPSGYAFSSWSASGGVLLSNPSSVSTTATVSDTGSMTANFQQVQTLSVQVSANSSSINTAQSSMITVTVTSRGYVVPGASVGISADGGFLSPPSGTTDFNGRLTTIFSSSSVGTFTITASASKPNYSSNSSSIHIGVSSVPLLAPSDLVATAVSSTRIDLSWVDNSASESDFHIERRSSGGSWTEIAEVQANIRSYSNIDLTASTTYYYRVCAHRHSDSAFSGYSNEASATTSPLGYVIAVQATGLPPGAIATVFVDGTSKGSFIGSPVVLELAAGSHAVSVDQYVPSGASEIRYHCTSSTQGVSSTTTVVFAYHREYYLTLSVDPPNSGDVSPGSGWYDADSPIQVSVGARSGYSFGHWMASIGISVANSESQVTLVTMTSAGSVSAIMQEDSAWPLLQRVAILVTLSTFTVGAAKWVLDKRRKSPNTRL
jgi:hypothetical protein